MQSSKWRQQQIAAANAAAAAIRLLQQQIKCCAMHANGVRGGARRRTARAK